MTLFQRKKKPLFIYIWGPSGILPFNTNRVGPVLKIYFTPAEVSLDCGCLEALSNQVLVQKFSNDDESEENSYYTPTSASVPCFCQQDAEYTFFPLAPNITDYRVDLLNEGAFLHNTFSELNKGQNLFDLHCMKLIQRR